MKIALITGINGQDGSYLAELLIQKNYYIVGLVRRSASEDKKLYNLEKILNEDKPMIHLENGDVSDASSIFKIVNKWKPDELYNLAAQSHVGVSFEAPQSTFEINTTGVLNCLEAIRQISPDTKFYQASTSEMFGDNSQTPQNELTQFSPVSPYACAKVAAHNLVVNYRKAYGLFACSGILFNHESERRGEQFVTRKITKAAARIKLGLQKELCLGNLEAQRDWGYAPEYVLGMWQMLQRSSPDDYVLATGETNSIKNFINFVSEACGFELMDYIKVSSHQMRPSEVSLLCGDSSKAKKYLGWQAKTKAKELAKIMYEADLAKEIINAK